jgi:hypothetical protein
MKVTVPGGSEREDGMVRIALAALLLGAGLWRAALDWRATIGEGYAYRFTSIGRALEAALPDLHDRIAGLAAGSDGAWWGPAVAGLLALPLALVLIGLAALLWLTRRRRERRR